MARPVIGICNTFSELTPCNAHFRDHAEWVKRGVLEAGGFPCGISDHEFGRNIIEANGDAVSQSGKYGCGRMYSW